ncbi:MAG: T9SS type A sorting domain-containing protein, partial [Sphingobacteriia bacterium]|nr:T9SS type A sorting domain-containing protein [Sphingobacteriia bacterium]
GSIGIFNSNTLTSLTGLDNIAANSIVNLYITNNSSLTTCEVQSICEYLAAPNGTVSIHSNAPGCNSPEEVIEACIISVEEITPPESFSAFPNPANDRLTIQLLLEKPEPIRINVLNATGQQMLLLADDQSKSGDFRTEIDISKWPAGVYWCRMQAGQANISQKIIKIN